MNRADKDASAGLEAESFEPVFQLPCAFVIIGNTGEASRFLDIFSQQTRKFYRQCLCLAASWPSKDDAVAARLVGSLLAWISQQLCRRLR